MFNGLLITDAKKLEKVSTLSLPHLSELLQGFFMGSVLTAYHVGIAPLSKLSIGFAVMHDPVLFVLIQVCLTPLI